jgi:hypothetical protein
MYCVVTKNENFQSVGTVYYEKNNVLPSDALSTLFQIITVLFVHWFGTL